MLEWKVIILRTIISMCWSCFISMTPPALLPIHLPPREVHRLGSLNLFEAFKSSICIVLIPVHRISVIHSIELSFLKCKLWIVMLFHMPFFSKGEQNSHNETMRYSLLSADCLLCTDFSSCIRQIKYPKCNVLNSLHRVNDYWLHLGFVFLSICISFSAFYRKPDSKDLQPESWGLHANWGWLNFNTLYWKTVENLL